MVTWIYTSIMLVSIVCCSLLLRRYQTNLSISNRDKWLVGLAAFAGAMIGAKLPFIVVEADDILTGTTWMSNGKTIMFGIVGGYVAVVAAKKMLGVRVGTGDSFVVPIAIAVAIGRIACFSAGCCFGTETTLPWGIHFSTAGDDLSIVRHPMQFYEAAFHGVAAIIAFVAYRKLYDPNRENRNMFDIVFYGNLLKAYIVCYLVFRFVTEFIRPEPDWVGTISVYQVAVVILLPVFISIWTIDVLIKIRRLDWVNRSTAKKA